jgi:hypothetical protein
VPGSNDILGVYVALHNQCLRIGSFARVVELFSEDGELTFETDRSYVFKGRREIGEAFAKYPPSEEIIVMEQILAQEGSGIIVTYACASHPGLPAGTFRIDVDQGKIKRLAIFPIRVQRKR